MYPIFFKNVFVVFLVFYLLCFFQCMSLCAECFHNGNHEEEGHDYNMFKSQAGGACDCGDASVMRKSGFCKKVRCRNLSINSVADPHQGDADPEL